MNRDEIIKAAEELATFFKSEAYAAVDPRPSLEHAKLVYSLIALVPKEGEVVVPEEPTVEMKEAFDSEWFNANWPAYLTDKNMDDERITAAYKAMLKTAKEEK